jgi:purine-nucleoside phosphorylase
MSETETRTCPLDDAVHAALADARKRGVPEPEALFLLGTGIGMLGSALQSPARLPLGKLAGTPDAWRDVLLFTGRIGTLSVWIVEDAPGPPDQGLSEPAGEPPWARAFPVWLAAAAGAAVCVHTSAGQSLPDANGRVIRPGSIAIVTDHVNLSGRTPLLALGESKLGPLFPDQSRLHNVELRKAAARRGKKLGVPFGDAVAACTPAPALETPAERAFWSRAGCDVAVQGLATPMHAAAHAGLGVLALVAVTDAGTGMQDVGEMVAQADKLAPAIEELLVALAPDVKKVARSLSVEEE